LIFFDGIYRLPGDRGKRGKEFKKWASAWRVKIINLSLSQPDVCHLRPYVVVATQDGEGIFKARCADSIGKRICRDFDLDVDRILWIEQIVSTPVQMLVAEFKPQWNFGRERFYSINWRPIRANELAAIRPFVDEAETIQNSI